MASVAQVRANRLNAQKSTGPRTPEGKAVVAQNAVKHGLLAQQVVVRGEDPGEFELFRDRMVQDLDPAGALEDLLAERVAHLGWRLRRAERFERAAYATLETDYAAREASTPPARRPQGEAQDEEETVLARVVVDDFGRARLLDRLLGYERRIENSLYRTVGELRKYRRLRESEPAVEPASSAASGVRRGVKCEVSSFKPEGRSPDSELHTSNFTLPTSSIASLVPQATDTFCGTKPIGVGSLEDREPGAEIGETGRGRPGYEEGPQTREDAFGNPETPGGVATNGAASEDGLCETKPNEAASEKSQVISQPG